MRSDASREDGIDGSRGEGERGGKGLEDDRGIRCRGVEDVRGYKNYNYSIAVAIVTLSLATVVT